MMKTNKLKNKIKNDIYQSTPEVYSKIKLDQINIDPFPEKKDSRRKLKFNFKYAFSSLITLVIVFVVVVLLIKPDGGTINQPVYNYSPLDSNEEVYAVSSVVATNLYLATFANTDSLAIKNSGNEMLINNEYDNLNKLLNSVESLINNKEKNNMKELISDDAAYDFMIEINSTDLLKYTNIYYLYYNIISESDLNPIRYGNNQHSYGENDDETEDEEDDYQDEKKDILEDIEDLDDSALGTVRLKIEGKIKFKNNLDFIYNVQGKMVENNNVEKIIFDVSEETNPNNYIRVIQSNNNKKQVFVFEEYVNNSLSSKNYMVLKADKDGDYSADLIVVDSKNNLMAKYEISKDADDKEIEIEYIILFNNKIEEGEIEIAIIEFGNHYQYIYKTKNDKGKSEHKGRRFRFNDNYPPGKGPVGFYII